MFGLADTHPKGHLLTVIPFGFYPEKQWTDDLELGAGELALALQSGGALPAGLPHTDPSFYLAAAAEWAHAYLKHPRRSEGLNLYDASGLAHYELVRALRQAGEPAGLAVDEARCSRGFARNSKKRGRPPRTTLRVRVPVGRSGYRLARRRPRGDGGGVRLARRQRPVFTESRGAGSGTCSAPTHGALR